MTDTELNKVKIFINTLGYYQCFNAVKDWFNWDEETTKINLKFALSQITNT